MITTKSPVSTLGSVGWLVAAANDVGGLHGETAKHHSLGIDQIPLRLHRLVFGEERFHAKRGQEVGLYGRLCQLHFPRDKKPATANAGRVSSYFN
jgi:hypothetical protein